MLEWGNKNYHTLDYELKKEFGQKVIKLSLDGGFSCPNRDGTIGTRGCLFCGEKGSGEFAAPCDFSIRRQLRYQIDTLSPKWKTNKYIAYFQCFTNTYGDAADIKIKYDEALGFDGVVGLAAATRPDCVPPDIMELLVHYNRKTFFWLELGLQTIHEKTAELIRRGYTIDCFEKTVNELKKNNIRTVVHLIAGLPGESKKDYLESVKYVARLGIWGVKIHLLYIQKGTDLEDYHTNNNLRCLDRDEYVEYVADSLELLPPDIIIHRLTGDGKRDLLIEPKWSLKKFEVLNEIDRELKRRNSWQGKHSISHL
jgi:uncharacterized protein